MQSQQWNQLRQLKSTRTQIFANDKVVTTEILDRILHYSHIINIQGDSYRLKEKQESGLLDASNFKNMKKFDNNLDENQVNSDGGLTFKL